jgi:sulfoxide reductase heme-binding subunit YedZ
MWVRFLPILSLGGNLWFFSPFELAGVAAFTLLTPVFITSNEWSVRTLGRAWRTIHALVYLVIWLVFLHVALQGALWQTGGTLLVAAVETVSLLWAKMETKNATVA